jgi:hypothetical protein
MIVAPCWDGTPEKHNVSGLYGAVKHVDGRMSGIVPDEAPIQIIKFICPNPYPKPSFPFQFFRIDSGAFGSVSVRGG